MEDQGVRPQSSAILTMITCRSSGVIPLLSEKPQARIGPPLLKIPLKKSDYTAFHNDIPNPSLVKGNCFYYVHKNIKKSLFPRTLFSQAPLFLKEGIRYEGHV